MPDHFSPCGRCSDHYDWFWTNDSTSLSAFTWLGNGARTAKFCPHCRRPPKALEPFWSLGGQRCALDYITVAGSGLREFLRFHFPSVFSFDNQLTFQLCIRGSNWIWFHTSDIMCRRAFLLFRVFHSTRTAQSSASLIFLSEPGATGLPVGLTADCLVSSYTSY